MIDGQTPNGVGAFFHKARHSEPQATIRLLASPFLSHDERQVLSDALTAARSVPPRTDLLRQDDPSDTLLFVTQGWACRYMATPSGELQYPALLVPGDTANLDTLMFDRLGYAVRTITRVTLVSLARSRALVLADRHPGIARTFTWLAIGENAVLSQTALSLGRRSTREALAHLLCELNVRLGQPDDGESRFAFPLTQEHIGNAIGVTAIHVNRVIRGLHRDGLIVVARGMLTIPCVASLRHVAGFDPRYLRVADRTDAI